MERITYRITLDAHRNGIQRTLQGFETADIMARRISVNLTSGGDTFELPMSNVAAMMYITTPSAKVPSINECVIDGNTIIYDCEPIVEEGMTEMQLKVIETSPNGAKKVLIAPRFAVEVTKSNANDVGAMQTTTFTALEQAIAKAEATYESRLLRVVIEDDYIFKVYYADGTVYENDYFRDAIYNGNALLSQSYAVGGAGVRSGEDTDNSKYYSNVSQSASEDAKKVYEEAHELMIETQKQANYTYFQVNFETGELGYVSTNAEFSINKETGDLETSRNETYTPEDVIAQNVEIFINEKSAQIDTALSNVTNASSLNYSLIKNNEKSILSNAKAISQNASAIQDNASAIQSVNNYTSLLAQSLNVNEQYAKGQINALEYISWEALYNDISVNMRKDLIPYQHIYINSKTVPAVYVVEGDMEWGEVVVYPEGTDYDLEVEHELNEKGFLECGHYKLYKLPTASHDPTLLSRYSIEVLEGTQTISADASTQAMLPYPTGFGKDNTIVIGSMHSNIGSYNYRNVATTTKLPYPEVSLRDYDILLTFGATNAIDNKVNYRIALLGFPVG